MTRYYSPNCWANREEKIEGWHHGLRRALWCHAMLIDKMPNPRVHPLCVIYAKDTGEPTRRPLNKRERDKIIEIVSTSPWRLTPQEVQDVIDHTKKPPWELGRAG